MTLVLAIVLPLAGSLAVGACARAPRRFVASVATAAAVLTLGAVAALAQAFAAGKEALVADLGSWLPIRGADVAFRLDASLAPVGLVLAAALAVTLAATIRRPLPPATYATALVAHAAANTLLAAANLVLLLVAWEIAALAGYVLLAGGRRTMAAAESARGALSAARLVDAGFLVAVLGILTVFRSVDLREVGSRVALQTLIPSAIDALRWCAALLALAALARGAQLPFSRRLGDAVAMDALSRFVVRALVAPGGVLLLARLAPIVPLETLAACGIVGALTAVFAVAVLLAQREGDGALAWLAVASLGAAFASLAWSSELALAVLAAHVLAQAALAAASLLAPGRVRWRPLLRTERARRAYGLARAGEAAELVLAMATRPLAQGTERMLRAVVPGVGAVFGALAALASAAHAMSPRRSLVVLGVGTLVLAAFWSAR